MKHRNDRGQFLKGISGNKRGRPNSGTTIIRKQLAVHHEEVINAILTAALGGDMQACKLIMERLCPPLKAQVEPQIVKLPRNGDLTQIAKEFIKATADGYLSSDVGAQMVSAISQLARITEINEKLKPEEEGEPLSHIRISIIGEDGIEKELNPRCQEEIDQGNNVQGE